MKNFLDLICNFRSIKCYQGLLSKDVDSENSGIGLSVNADGFTSTMLWATSVIKTYKTTFFKMGTF